MRALVRDAGLDRAIAISSAGTGDWHMGDPADQRALDALARRGYDAGSHLSRQFVAHWFGEHDLVLALDRSNLSALRGLAPPGEQHKLHLLREFDPKASADQGDVDVPDPFYGGAQGFEAVLDMVERTCRALLEHVRGQLRS